MVIVMKTPAEYSRALTAARELAARTGQPDPFHPGGVIYLDGAQKFGPIYTKPVWTWEHLERRTTPLKRGRA